MVIDLDLLFPNGVVIDDLGLVVRNVPEQVPSVGVPKGPDVRLRCREVLVRIDPTVLRRLHAASLGVEQVRFRASPRRHHDLLGVEGSWWRRGEAPERACSPPREAGGTGE